MLEVCHDEKTRIENVGYLLAMFEGHIVDRKIKNDHFDLLAMRKLILDDEELESMGLKRSMEGCSILELNRLSPPHVKSKHVVVCAAGFMQQDVESNMFWDQLVGVYKHAEVFALSWNGCTPTDFLTAGRFKNDKKKKKSRVTKNMINVYSTFTRQFVFAVDQAMLSGTLLAHYLVKSSFAENRAVQLVGYSLGGVVCFNAMKVLKRMSNVIDCRAGRILNDVMIWAGAYVIGLSKKYKEVREKSQNCSVVNGNLNNIYSFIDLALHLESKFVFKGTTPVGLGPIFKEVRDEDLADCKLATNYNMTSICTTHTAYGFVAN